MDEDDIEVEADGSSRCLLSPPQPWSSRHGCQPAARADQSRCHCPLSALPPGLHAPCCPGHPPLGRPGPVPAGCGAAPRTLRWALRALLLPAARAAAPHFLSQVLQTRSSARPRPGGTPASLVSCTCLHLKASRQLKPVSKAKFLMISAFPLTLFCMTAPPSPPGSLPQALVLRVRLACRHRAGHRHLWLEFLPFPLL